ncbi:unannotated protein [freshwater metagenome]|uniref:Unannotated protein n=1 Tax=freshwater metagenome TaxID=449393 RepID=A0A6J7LTC8_9ZZZZ
MTKSNVSGGISALYWTSTGASGMKSSMPGSSPSGTSCPFRTLHTLWMVEMTTLLDPTDPDEVSGSTLYNSVNLRPSSGVVQSRNSRSVWSARLLRSTRNRTRLTPPNFSSR